MNILKVRLALVLGGLGLLGIGTDDEPGWLARALASTDSDVDAAITSYESEDYPAATERLDAAVARRGERAELYYDRGLILIATGDLDGARALFQNGTLSEHPQVRASSHYQLGSLALAQEQWDVAIEAFRECLRVQPDHHNAKWNLELALLRKREEEKKQQEEEQEKQDQEKQDQEKQDQENQDQQDQDQQDQDQQEQGDQPQDQDQQEQQDQPQDQDQQEQGDQPQQDQQQQDQQDQQQQDQQQQDQQQQDQQQQDQQQPKPGEPQPQPIEGGDLDAALDELDRQDAFMFGRPRGANRKVEKDW